MKRTWPLNPILDCCPPGWKEFIRKLEEKKDYDCPEGFSEHLLNLELAKYRAKLYTVRGHYFVDFFDERCYTIFLIKYGGYQGDKTTG